MNQPIYNLHNHTPFSDGAYSIDELCDAHLSHSGLKIDGIGISDHLFCTPTSRVASSDREFRQIFGDEARIYAQHVLKARKRWSGKLRILCGCEINWPLNKSHLDVIRTMLEGVDYVLFEYMDWAALTQLANQARRWPCPVGLAHTDVAEQFSNTAMDQVVRTMANARIFYEISSKFLPLRDNDRWFNLLPKHRVAVSLGTDTHDDLRCIADIDELHGYAVRRGLEPKLFAPKVEEPEPVSARA